MVDVHVPSKSLLYPLKLFKNRAHYLYSKMKGGVDGSTQLREIIRAPTGDLKWENRIVDQTLKNVIVNALVGWSMLERIEVLQNPETFQNLDRYSLILKKVQYFGEFFFFDVSMELFIH